MEQSDKKGAAATKMRSPRQQPAFVTELNENDVLLGRGRPSINYVGNKKFRTLVATRKQEYANATRNLEKNAIALQILDEVQLRRGGRFLQRIDSPQDAIALGVPDGVNSAWKIAEESLAIEKCKQTLRDKDPPPPQSSTRPTQNTSTVSGTDSSSTGNLLNQGQAAAIDQPRALASQQPISFPTSITSGWGGGGSANIPTMAANFRYGLSGGVSPAGATTTIDGPLNMEALRNLQQQAGFPSMGHRYPFLQLQSSRLQLQLELARLQQDRLLQILARTVPTNPLPAGSFAAQLDREHASRSSRPTNINLDRPSGGRPSVAGSTLDNNNRHGEPFSNSLAGLYPLDRTALSATLPGFSGFDTRGDDNNAVSRILSNYAVWDADPLSMANEESIQHARLLHHLGQQLPTLGTVNESVTAGPLDDQSLIAPLRLNRGIDPSNDGRLPTLPLPGNSRNSPPASTDDADPVEDETKSPCPMSPARSNKRGRHSYSTSSQYKDN